MSTPDWRQLGFLTPDAPECQQDVWALQARLRNHLQELLDGLASATAEPSWSATLAEAAERSRELCRGLLEEAGPAALERLADDDVVREFEAALGEVLSSGHVPSLIVTGYAVLGELGLLPIRLLEEIAGPNVRLLCGRITTNEDHRLLGRLLSITHPGPRELEQLRKLTRHLTGQLFAIYQSWRQTLHTLGVDGEWLAEEGAATVRRTHEALGFKTGPADLKAFREG